MRTRFSVCLHENRKDQRPILVTYTDKVDLLGKLCSAAMAKFHKRTKGVEPIAAISGTMNGDGAFQDGTAVVVYMNPMDCTSTTTTSSLQTSSCSASIDFLHSATPVDDMAVKQLTATAMWPGMIACVGMPDLHPGSGASPVGAAFLADRVYPDLVGQDIGCGMALYKLHSDSHFTEKGLKRIASHVRHGFLDKAPSPVPSRLCGDPFIDDHAINFGTIGGGNHFAELQIVRDIADPETEILTLNSTYVLVHSGSRTLGEAILGTHRNDTDRYLHYHDIAVEWASANRRAIAQKFATACGAELTTETPILDICHNNVVRKGDLYLHRKGAAPTDIPSQLIAIPGSRGSITYMVQRVDNDALQRRCLWSAAHGAGRAISRKKLSALLSHRYGSKRSATDELERTPFNGYVVCDKKETLFEEAPEAYKDIDLVIKDLVAAGTVTVVAKMIPLITCKM